MTFKNRCFSVVAAALCVAATSTATGTVHHDLVVRIEPSEHRIQVVDRVNFAEAVTADEGGAYRFILHAGLEPRVATPGWRLQLQEGPVEAGFLGINATTDTVPENVPLEAFLLLPADDASGPVELV